MFQNTGSSYTHLVHLQTFHPAPWEVALPSSQGLGISKDADSTISLEDLFQHCTTLTVFFFSFYLVSVSPAATSEQSTPIKQSILARVSWAWNTSMALLE